MLLFVFSDTHGVTAPMCRVIAQESPDAVVHLGDHCRDTDCLKKTFPHTPLYGVQGNCDFFSEKPLVCQFQLGGFHFFATHGHRYRVKLEPDLDALGNAARLAGANVALFGHTHTPVCRQENGLWLFNPGSAGTGRLSYGAIRLYEGADPDFSILPLL